MSYAGDQEILQLRRLKNKFPQRSVRVIEPSTRDINRYKETVRQKSSYLAGVEFEWHNKTFQEYMKSTEEVKKFHFITIIHAVYYIGEVEEAVGNLYELLAPGGMIYMVAVSGNK